MSLLSIISGTEEGAAVLCGVAPPTSIVGSTDPNAPLFLRLAQQEGRELARRHDWQRLKVDYTFASLATEAQTVFPSDFERLLPQPELWNRSIALRYAGPTDDVTWGRLKGLNVSAATPGYWRLIGDVLQITPAPAAGNTLALPYMSNNWVAGNKAAFALDTDTAIIPERLMTLGIIWRWKKSKGFEYAEDMSTYEREVERACSRDRGLGPVILSTPRRDDGLGGSTWPGTIVP